MISSLSAMLKNINEAVIATNAEGKIKLMNSLAESLSGWKLNDVIGKELREVFTPLNKVNKSLHDLHKESKHLSGTLY